MRFKLKLELEKIYKNYCNSDLESLRGEDEKFIDMMFVFVEFRLNVSGGNESSCMMSMDNVSNFLNEILDKVAKCNLICNNFLKSSKP